MMAPKIQISDIFKIIHNHYLLSVSEMGLVKGAELVFVGEKNSKDYHEEMNGEHFEKHIE